MTSQIPIDREVNESLNISSQIERLSNRRVQRVVLPRTFRVLVTGSAIVLLLTWFAIDRFRSWQVSRSSLHERYALQEIGDEVFDAAEARSNRKQRYVASFDELYAIIAQSHPEIVAGKDATNPFPGLLNGDSYGRYVGRVRRAGTAILWSENTFPHANKGEIYWTLMADGSVRALTAHELKMAQ